MAQYAADAAARKRQLTVCSAGRLLVGFPSPTRVTFLCGSYASSTPCLYALRNGFGNGSDVVSFEFSWLRYRRYIDERPDVTNEGGARRYYALGENDIYEDVRLNCHRRSKRQRRRRSSRLAARCQFWSPHPSMSGALSTGGNSSITILGGDQRSIRSIRPAGRLCLLARSI